MNVANENEKVIIGRFGSVYGIKGWIKIHSFTTPPDNILNYTTWHATSKNNVKTLTVEACKAHGKIFIAKIAGFDTPEDVRVLTNFDIAIDKSELPKLKKGEYYWSDLIGMEVYTLDKQLLGTVDHLLETGANDILVVKGEHRHLIPYTENIIQSIDPTEQRIIVDWDPELLT